MTEWRLRPISDLCTHIVDCVNKTAPISDVVTPFKMLRTTNVRNGWIDTSNTRRVEEAVYERWTRRIRPQRGDVILTREAPLGEVGMLRTDEPVFLGQRLVMYRSDAAECDPHFLLYSMLGPIVQAELRSLGSGATVEHLRVPDCERLTIPCPELPIQKRIGAVLSAIDALIENNRRRVEVLEEMARAIYGEWFVHFRYPGHQDTTRVDSPLGPLPVNWTARKVDDVARLIRGRSYRKAELVETGGLPFVNLKCMMRGGGFRRDGLKRFDGRYSPEQLVRAGDIVVAVTDLTQGREILARATLVPRFSEKQAVISLDIVRLIPRDTADRLWVFAALRWSDFAGRVKEYANGSTVLHLAPVHLMEALVIWPSLDLRERFSSVLRPIVKDIDSLNDAAESLLAMRDALLPKLLTGQIDVSSLDLDALVEDSVA